MQIYLDDIKKHDFLVKVLEENNWGKAFLNLKKGQKFVLFFDLREKSSTYIVNGYEILYEINDLVYKKKAKTNSANISWFSEPFDSDTYFLYSLLKTAIIESNAYAVDSEENIKKLDNIFLEYKEKDFISSKSRLKIKDYGKQEVNSEISFQAALDNIFKYNRNPIQGIKMIYDLINQYTSFKYNTSIYGGLLTHFVLAIRNPNGGLIPETTGKMRYMIIGEKAAKDDEQLKRAKEYLRSGNDVKDIFYETGWYFNKLDYKWRKNIDTSAFMLLPDAMTQEGQSFGVVPKYMNGDFSMLKDTARKILSNEKTMLELINEGYDVRLSDYVFLPKIFELYPDLKNIYSFFFISEEFTGINKKGKYYYSNEAPKCIVLTGGESYSDVGYIALHEIQHYIQYYEGFSNGGNLYLADIISAVGGGSLKEFLLSLDQIKKEFKKVANLIPLVEYESLIEELKNMTYSTYSIRHKHQFIGVDNYINSYLSYLSKLTSSVESVNFFSAEIITYLIEMYALVIESNDIIKKFINKYLDSEYMKIFEDALKRNIETVKREQGMVRQGWNGFDLYTLSFETYKALGGEIEARFTQQTTQVPKELQSYLNFLTSELVEPSKITVINNELLVNQKDIKGGIELTEENKYIIHLFSSIDNSVPLLHETGHLLYDICLRNPELIDDVAEGQMEAEKFGFTDSEEFFCEAFVDFIHRINIDEKLTLDMSGLREIKNITCFDNLFNYILFSDKIKIEEQKLSEMLKFVKMIENA